MLMLPIYISSPLHSFFFTILFQWTLTPLALTQPVLVMREMEVVAVEVLRVFIKQTAKGFWRPH